MTIHNPLILQRVKKIPLLLLLITLTACNGDGSSNQFANGIGGTGVTMGRVTAFGSIYVNGIKFNTDNATFIRDGISAKQQDDFNTGEIVKVIGNVNTNKKTGIATEVIFSDVLEGTVSALANESENQIEIMGQTVSTDKLTVFHGFEQLSDLFLGNLVEVSGFVTKKGITATSIKLIADSFSIDNTLEVEGYIDQLDTSTQTFKLNQLTVNYANAEFKNILEQQIEEGSYLIIRTQQEINNKNLQASEIELFDNQLEVGVSYELEGYITEFDSEDNFKIDIDTIHTNADTIFIEGSKNDLNLDSHIIVTGTVNAEHILIAEEIKIFDTTLEVSVEANIEAIDLVNNKIIILGQTIAINDYTLLSDDTREEFVFLDLQQFIVGETVFITAHYEGNRLIADRLSKIPTDDLVYLSGVATSTDLSLNTLSLFGNTININNETFYLDKDFNEISKEEYFKILTTEKTQIEVIGEIIGDKNIIAVELAIMVLP